MRALILLLAVAIQLPAQQHSLPLRQSALDAGAADANFTVHLDSTVDARWLGGGATMPRWDVQGQWAYFQYALDPKPIVAGAVDDPWWRVSRDGRRVEPVEKADAILVPANVQYTRDGRRAAYFHRGELRYWRQGMREPRLLLTRADNISPRWSADEREVRFMDGNALWAADPETGALRQLTRPHTARAPERPNAMRDELKKQQLEIFEFVQRSKADRDTNAARAKLTRPPMPIPTPVQQNQRALGVELSPRGDYVTYLVQSRADSTPTVFTDFVTETGYAEQRTSRPKVGDPPGIRRAAIVKADPYVEPDSVKVVWVDTAGFGKPVIATQIQWNRQGTRVVVEFMARDIKDRWIVLVNPEDGKHVRILEHQSDSAWYGGAGQTGSGQNPGWMIWLPDGETLAVTSEASGWAHLYLVSMDGTKRALTSGEWEIRTLALSRDESRWWISAGRDHPNELHLYSLPLRGGALTQVDAAGEGEARYSLSPDEQVMAYLFATPRELTDIYLQPVRPNARPTRVTRSGTDAFYRIPWARSDFVSFDDEQGKPIYARVYRPLHAHPNRPAVFEIHGAGYAQGVRKAFANSGGHGGALNAQYWTQRGATYVVLDYRGSAGYGRDMRTAIYRAMGDRDVNSAVVAVKYLAEHYDVDARNVGLFGCSYGGFFTLMALFKHPGVFQAGAAQCSVTDWAHYNHWYTSRILNGPPANDSLAYRVSSPIYHAAALQDRLLLQHGLVDGNVQYQDAARLAQRLIELGKDFEFVTYPVEAHGWRTRASRIDSQRRIAKLWEETIFRTNGAVQAGEVRQDR